MRIVSIAAAALLAGTSAATPASAAEYAQTVRLGNCVVRAGTTVVKLVQCAGEPVSKTTSGINLGNGQIDNVWIYQSNNRTVVIHVASAVVTKIEVKSD